MNKKINVKIVNKEGKEIGIWTKFIDTDLSAEVLIELDIWPNHCKVIVREINE